MLQKLFLSLAMAGSSLVASAQSLRVGSAADELLRWLQLTNQVNDSSSLISRPLVSAKGFDSGHHLLRQLNRTALHFERRPHRYLGVLPLSLQQQYFSHHPFHQNDGTMIPAKGYQAQLSAGIYGGWGPLTFQLQPEVVLAANPDFKRGVQFGTAPKGGYHKVFAGQSSVRLRGGPVAISATTENLWWGPGRFHSIVMSNQAPGFFHVKLHNARPLRTPIGLFEWTILGGTLTSDPGRTFDNNDLNFRAGMIANRYLNAYVLAYQPRFLPGLSVGFSRVLQQYWEDINASGNTAARKYLPIIFKPIQKQDDPNDDKLRTDQLGAAFFRWRFPKSQAEVYGEYAYNDYKANIRDFMLNLPHSSGYLVGFRKAFDMTRGRKFDFGLEMVQLSESPDLLVRSAGYWYLHGQINEGYTHQNQVLGSAFATNAQTFSLGIQNGVQRSALTLQRFQRDYTRQAPRWNDWVVGISHSQLFKDFFLNGNLMLMQSTNYSWEKSSNPFQLAARLGVHYYFHD